MLLALLGFAAVTQVKANEQDDQYVGARQGDLIQYINNLSLASQRAESEIARLQRTRDALRSDTRARRTALDRAQQQATTLGILAGTVPVVGPGVRVTVTDDKGGVGSNQLLEGLEELRDAGAEAIELNDKVRVVAQTSLKDTGGGVARRRQAAEVAVRHRGDRQRPEPGHRAGLQGRLRRRGAAAQRRRQGRRGRGRRLRRREDLHRRGARDTAVHPAREDGIACRLHLRPTID